MAGDIAAVLVAPKADLISFSSQSAKDAEIDQMIVTTLLEETEVAIDIAANGFDAVKMFEIKRISMI